MIGMILQHREEKSVKILEETLARLLGLSHRYHKQLLMSKNQRLRGTLERLIKEKSQHAKLLQTAILNHGGDPRGVRIETESPVNASRELIPTLYQEEQALSLWYREQITSIQDGQVRTLFEALLKDEDQHLQALKELYRDVTYC
jgi:rubrerythrin